MPEIEEVASDDQVVRPPSSPVTRNTLRGVEGLSENPGSARIAPAMMHPARFTASMPQANFPRYRSESEVTIQRMSAPSAPPKAVQIIVSAIISSARGGF